MHAQAQQGPIVLDGGLATELEAIAEYGSFAKAPLDNSAQEMIFLLRRARS